MIWINICEIKLRIVYTIVPFLQWIKSYQGLVVDYNVWIMHVSLWLTPQQPVKAPT